MEKKVKVDEQLCTYIESLTYTAGSMRLLLVDAAERGLDSSPVFDKWERKYTEANMELEIAKRQLEKQFVVPTAEGKRFRWSLDFDSAEVSIEVIE